MRENTPHDDWYQNPAARRLVPSDGAYPRAPRKAALNHAWKAGHVTSDDAWRRAKPFRGVETARVRYLSEAECLRLVNACEPAFRDLVRGAMLTGCRYSELTTVHVADFNADAGVVTVRDSKAASRVMLC